MNLVQILPNAHNWLCVSIKHALKKQGIKTLKPLISQGFQVSVSILVTQDGASGDTELFEKASNINGFQGGRVANNLYISLFSGDCFSDSRPFSIPQFKCRDLGEKSAFSFAVACVLNMTWVFSLRQSCHAGGTGLLYEPRLSHSLRRRVGTWRPRERQTGKKPSIKERLEQSRKECANQSKAQPHREKPAPER